jgi:hypothetical protein
VLAFQSLTLVANQRISSHSDVGEVSMVIPMLSDANLIGVIKKFLSGMSENGPTASSVQFSTVSVIVHFGICYSYTIALSDLILR